MQCRLHLRNVFAAKCKLRQYHALKCKYFSLNQRFHTFPTFKGIWGLWKTNISSTLFNTFPVNSITIWRRMILPRLQVVIVLSFCMLSISRLFQGSTSVYLMCSSCRFDFSSPICRKFVPVSSRLERKTFACPHYLHWHRYERTSATPSLCLLLPS